MGFELKKIAWLGNSYSTSVSERPSYKPPVAQDHYIAPEAAQPQHSQRGPRSLFFGGLFQRGKILREAEGIVTKLSRLHLAPDNQKARFFDCDLPRLHKLHAQEPKRIETLLQEWRQATTDKTDAEPWFHLVQIALGDNEAFLKELELLG